ncbi:roadblock/LC7 domain-containing protein [Streptomyces sp. BR123]|uniref:roadblock/LC7 domain-containing protein n=1 Tax=Streptomyces sp. BR123 TaxID=2749828 RepID=UPI0015C4C020|nr:roadblock/LC7 domain-containing protein [Streptomyces sp. BR123]NXY97154.1 roadblock/LC7 domain-containing protein [Streptomyces sp. BR123]
MTTRKAQLAAEARTLRNRVVGVTDVVVASVDGLLITAETDDTAEPESLAALTAATLNIARRAGSMTSRGLLHHTVSRFTDGYLVTHTLGEMALIGVLGDAGMDIARLHTETQASAQRITTLLTETSADAAAPGNASAGQTDGTEEGAR